MSADSKGTWTVTLDPNPFYTALRGDDPILITPLARNPAYITVALGKCCYDLDSGVPQCADGITECECEGLPPPMLFFAGEQCTDEPDECELGACCLVDGTCQGNVAAAHCLAMAGQEAFLGSGSECLGDGDATGYDDACEPPPELLGACCLPGGACRDNLTLGWCRAIAGDDAFAGPGTACLGDADANGTDDVCEPQVPVPAASGWGLLILVLGLLALAKVHAGRRHPATEG